MNKTELITKLAKKTGLTQAKAAEAVDALFNAKKGLIVAGAGRWAQGHAPGLRHLRGRGSGRRAGPQPGHRQGDHDPRAQVPGLQGWQDAQGEGREVAADSPGSLGRG